MHIRLNPGQCFLSIENGEIIVTANEDNATQFKTMEYAVEKLSELRKIASFDDAAIVEDFSCVTMTG